MSIIPRCSETGSLNEQCMRPPTPHDRHHGWWNGVETWWSTPPIATPADRLAEAIRADLARQNDHFTAQPMNSDTGRDE